MRLVGTSALWAGLITALSVLAATSTYKLPTSLQGLGSLGAYVVAPAFFALVYAGRRGPGGMPAMGDAVALTFLGLWAVVYAARVVWRRFCA
jgi:hypothetical protein